MLEKLLAFIQEMERLKTVTRQNQTLDGRFENAAEHSWQLGMMALVLQGHFPERVSLSRVLSMLLLHDVGEIGAGDTSVFDELGKRTSYDRELKSVKQSLAYLPHDLREHFLALWQEFEQGQTPEARFARCLDALAPLLNHFWIAKANDNPTGLTASQVLAKKAFIAQESPELWALAQDIIEQSVAKGLYLRDETTNSAR